MNRTTHSAGPAAARRVEAALKSLATMAARRQDTRAAAAAVPAVRQALPAIAPQLQSPVGSCRRVPRQSGQAQPPRVAGSREGALDPS